MFKAYASSDASGQKADDERKPTTWLENQSFSAPLPNQTLVRKRPVTPPSPPPVIIATIPAREEKKAILPSAPTVVFPKKSEPTNDVFHVDRRRDRANITVSYTTGVPRYGVRFCHQRPLGAPSTKPTRKERIRRYFHHKIDTADNPISDGFVRVDARLEQLNVAVREQPQSFDVWKDLIDYQTYLYKTQGEEEKIKALYNKQLAIIDRALELNAHRLQYRLCRLNLRTRSRLFDRETILNEWTSLIKDCLKSSDDRTINETWFSYVQYLTNHVDLFSIDKLDSVFAQYYSTYIYHMQTRSEKERRLLLNHMIDMFHLWTCLLHEAGYSERAVALYQAMIELNFSRSADFVQRVERLKQTWDTAKVRFGEPKENVGDRRTYVEEQLKILSEEENRLFDSNFSSWNLIEDKREHFYQWKILNEGMHFHSSLLESLTDSSQIDEEISKMNFDRAIRPFLFQCQDQRQLLQLFVNYLSLINGQPHWNLFQEILNRWKLSLSAYVQQEFFLDDELSSLYAFIHPVVSQKSEKSFSCDFISRVYQEMLAEPTLKAFQLDLLLLYWYYLASNIRELKEQNSSLYKVRLKSLQSIIKKYLALDEYRTCLRLYTHYGRLEWEYFQRLNESRRIFDVCFQTIRTNPTNFNSFESFNDLCYYLSTMLKCEFDLNQMFDRMLKSLEKNSIKDSLDKPIDREKLSSLIEFVLKKLFPDNQFNEIITLVIECLKTRKVSKWDQQTNQDWPSYLRQNVPLSLEILFIFLNYSFLLNDPFEKLHQIFLHTLLPIINDQRTKFTQMVIDDLFRFYLSRLWNHLFADRIRFDQCTTYLHEIFEQVQTPSMILNKFIAIYSCFLPLYGSSVEQFEQKLLSYQYNQKPEFRLMNKTFVLEMNFLRHIKIQRANETQERVNSGYEHRVRHILRQLIFDYPTHVQLWSFYEYFERYSPNNQIRLKAVLYDALQNCPWTKSFYLKSIGNVTNETEWKFFLNVMMKSHVHILFSMEEFDMFKELFQMKTDQSN